MRHLRQDAEASEISLFAQENTHGFEGSVPHLWYHSEELPLPSPPSVVAQGCRKTTQVRQVWKSFLVE